MNSKSDKKAPAALPIAGGPPRERAGLAVVLSFDRARSAGHAQLLEERYWSGRNRAMRRSARMAA